MRRAAWERICGDCKGAFFYDKYGFAVNAYGQYIELAEVVRDGKHMLVHVGCMKEGEQVA